MKRVVVLFSIAILMLMMFCTTVNANTSYENELIANTQEVKTGQEVVLTISMKNVEDTQKGLNAYSTKIEYDTNVFEEVTITSFENQNDWCNLQYNAENQELVAINKSGIEEGEEILTLTLQVKNTAPVGETVVKLTKFVSSEGIQDIEAGDKEVTLTIVRSVDDNNSSSSNTSENNNSSSSNTSENNNSSSSNASESNNSTSANTSSNNSSSSNTSENKNSTSSASDSTLVISNNSTDNQTENKASGLLPKTGAGVTGLICLFLIELCCVVAFVSYKKAKHVEYKLSKKSKLIIVIVLGILFTLQIAITIYAATVTFFGKGDVNKDGSIDYIDVILLEKHLISFDILPEENWIEGDMNADGKITVTDLSSLIWKIENKDDLMCEIEDILPESYYIEKGQQLTFSFEAIFNKDITINQIQINGTVYDVQTTDNTNYTVIVPIDETAGVKKFTFEKLYFENEETIDISIEKEVEVLKSVPIVTSYTIEEDNANSRVIVKIDIQDDDNAINSAIFTVEDLNITKDLQSGENQIELTVEDGKTYIAYIDLSYDLDTNSLNNITGEQNTGNQTYQKEIKLNIDYNLSVSNLKTYNGNTESKLFSRQDNVILKFTSTNSTSYIPEKVKINGTTYDVTQEDGNIYSVDIGTITKTGKTTLAIEEIILSNGKVLILDNVQTEIEVEKAVPTITNFESVEDDNSISFTFNIVDEDKVMENAYIVLLDGQETEIGRKSINKDTTSVTINTTYTDKYTVQIISDYTLSETNSQTSQIIYTEEITAKLKISVASVVANNYYVAKNGELELTYTFDSNRVVNINILQINYIEYATIQISDNTYKVTVQAEGTSGVQEFILRKLIAGDTTVEEVAVEKVIQLEVLKEKPYIANYILTEDLSNNTVTIEFELVDDDNAFISGYTILESDEKTKHEIQKGTNTITYTVTPNQVYNEFYYITYDLDTNSLNEITGEQNNVEDELLETKQIELVANYEVEIDNLKCLSLDDEEKIYFEKNENLKLTFKATSNTIYVPEKVVIGGKEYQLTNEDGTYSLELEGFSTSGIKEISIDSIILNNGREIELEDGKVKIEILKTTPTVTSFTYETNEAESKLSINIELKDEDATITNLKTVITDEAGQVVSKIDLSEKYLNGEELEFDFAIDNTNDEFYQVQIIAIYDLDTNTLSVGENEYENKILYEQEIETGSRYYELKDIQDIVLYEKNGDVVSAVSEVDLQNITLENYLVRVIMEETTDYYASIKNYEVEDGKLYFTLDTSNIVQYRDNTKNSDVIVEYGTIDEKNIAKRMDFETLIEQIKANPAGTYELTGNLDASVISSSDDFMLPVDFSGTLNGNGYTIKNLTKPLFSSLNGATIKNLVIQNAGVTSKGGILAISATTTIITNVHLTDCTLTGTISPAGGLIGSTSSTIHIENSSITNSSISGGKRTGGFIGWASDSANVTIENSYVQGNVTGSSDAVGGLIGQVNGNIKIENCYSNTYIKSNGTATGGIIGYYNNGTMVLNNNLSLADSATGGKRVHGNGNSNSSSNNYELAESSLTSNASGTKVIEISREDIDQKFFEKTLDWDTDIWNTEVDYTVSMPILKNADPNTDQTEEIPKNENIYIPEYSRIKNISNYDENKEILYANLYKIMPFYDATYLVSDGSKIPAENILNQKIIDKIVPYDKNGNMVTILTDKSYDTIDHVKIVFEDDSSQIYKLTDGSKNGIFANYILEIETEDSEIINIGYNYPTYLLDSTNTVIKSLVNIAELYEYSTDLDILTSESDSRLYVDFYENITQKQIEDFIQKLLANTEDYYLYMDNEVMNTRVLNEVSVKLKELLYAYNYYNKWYDIDVDGVNLKDIVYYGILYDNMNATIMTNKLISTTTSNRQTNTSHTFYKNIIANYTGKENIGAFIDYFIGTIGSYEDVNDWFTENYQGLVLEVQAKGYEGSDIKYRAWKHLKQRELYMLPLLTLEENAAFVISCPTQIMIGAQRIYITDPNNASQRATLYEKMEEFGELVSEFYGTTAGLVSADRLNLYSDVQIDRYITLASDGTSQVQTTGTTEEPFHKYFNDAIGQWGTALQGVAAYAYGDRIFWVVYTMLGSTSFNTWSHETGHDQDSKIFLYGNGRRSGAGGEDYADGNTSQSVGDMAYNFNLAYNWDNSADKGNNLTTERINSIEKIENYYANMFEALDFLDYVEALAFLNLTSEEQAKIGVQVYYPNVDNTEEAQDAGDSTTGYRLLTADDFETMNLETVEDLWDNHIIIYPGVTETTSIGIGRYGYKTSEIRRWYQPHNDNGVPDSYSLKQLAWEMLGIGGYEGGYVTYYSKISANDLEGIQKVTGDSTMTWKKYKLGRYEKMQENWNSLSYLLDTDELLDQFKEALTLDCQNSDRSVSYATNLRKLTYHYIKSATNDFRVDDIFKDNSDTLIVHISTAEQLKQTLEANPSCMIELDNNIDMSSLCTGSESAIFNTITFTGSLNGNGHTITGLTQPLFSAIKFSYIHDLSIDGANIIFTSIDNVGSLAQTITKSYIENVHITNSTVQAKNYAGGLAGRLTTTYINNCSVNANVTATTAYVGGLSAFAYSYGIISNCYTTGNITANGNRTGGIVGYFDTNAIKNCFTNCYVSSTTTTLAGGLLGYTNNAIVENNISFATGKTAYLFDSQTATTQYEKYSNNYEYSASNLTSTTTKSGVDFTGKITRITSSETTNEEFYTSILGWSKEIWNFNNITTGGLPKLQSSLDTNNLTSAISQIEIASVEDLQKIKDAPDKIYVLTSDIDASSITDSSSAIVTTAFYGRLDGNNHKISNLNTALFDTVYGQIINLEIENVNINKGSSEYANVIAKFAYGAYVSNVKINNVTLTGNNYIAVLFGYDRSSSTIENVQVTNATVNGATGSWGCYNSLLIGRKNGGTISNVLVQGNLTVQYTDNGPIVGEATNVTISNTISDVEVTRTGEVKTNQNAGFVGYSRGTTTFTNCIALGNVTESEEGTQSTGSCYKFSANIESTVTLTNCYEIEETTGITNAVEGSSQTTISISDETARTVEFYQNTLGLSADIWNFTNVEVDKIPKLK